MEEEEVGKGFEGGVEQLTTAFLKSEHDLEINDSFEHFVCDNNMDVGTDCLEAPVTASTSSSFGSLHQPESPVSVKIEVDLEGDDYCSGGESDTSYDFNSDCELGPEDMDDSDFEEDIDVRLQWQTKTAGMCKLPFTGKNELLVPTSGLNVPCDWYLLLMDDEFLEQIVKFTNENAWSKYFKPNLPPNARINRWKEVTLPELKIFIGLLFHMGTVKVSRLTDYWKTNRFFNFGCVREQMPRDRFLLIMHCLRFCSSEKGAKAVDRLKEVRMIIEYFNRKMQEVYYPARKLFLDESTVVWRGRIYFKQSIRRYNYNCKLYSLCEPRGLTVRLAVHGGRGGEFSGKGHASKVVSYLMKDKLNAGHSLYLSSYYTGVLLAAQLLEQGTFCTGILKPDRKYLPLAVKTATLSKAETCERFAGGIMVAKWQSSNREVIYLSTEFSNEMLTYTTRSGDQQDSPVPMIHYNEAMKEDKHDQLAYYPCENQRVGWYRKMFIHVLQVLMFNSYKLYCFANPKSVKFYDYRLAVIDALLPAKLGPDPRLPQQNTGERHVLMKIAKRTVSGRVCRRRCRVCAREGKYTKVTFMCLQCPSQPGLCPVGCFDKFHAT